MSCRLAQLAKGLGAFTMHCHSVPARFRFVLLAALVSAAASTAAAQVPAASPPPAIAVTPRNQAEQNVVNLSTTESMRRFGHHFRITHRFARDLRRGSFSQLLSDLFGLDNGAVIGLDYRFAPMTNVQVGVYRSLLLKTIQVSGRVDAWKQGPDVPVAVSMVASVEGTNNLRDNRAPAFGLAASRSIGEGLILYATPTFVWNSSAVHDAEAVDDGHEDHDHTPSTISPFDDGESNTAFVGLGARVRVRPRMFVVLEYAPRVAGHSPTGRGVWGFAFERQTGGHLFQLNLSNSFGTTYGQTAIGGERSNIYLGFNLARRW